MTKAEHGNTVHIHYTGKLEDGTVFDSSQGRDPLVFELGAAQVIPGLDMRMRGMEVGEKRVFEIPVDEAYGAHHPEGVQKIDKTQLPAGNEPQVGMQLQAQTPDGREVRFVITQIEEDTITVDANHPLAGKDLTFDVELVAVH